MKCILGKYCNAGAEAIISLEVDTCKSFTLSKHKWSITRKDSLSQQVVYQPHLLNSSTYFFSRNAKAKDCKHRERKWNLKLQRFKIIGLDLNLFLS